MTTSVQAPSTASGGFDLATWLRRHQTRLLWVLGALALAAAVVWWTMESGRRAERQAERVLNEARVAFGSGNLPLAANDLGRLSDQFPRTRSAQEGALLLAQIRLNQGQHQQAITFLRDFLDRGPREEFRAGAWGLLGAAYEDLGQSVPAGEAYLEASRSARFDFLKAQYLSDAGRGFWAAGDTARALEAYRAIVTQYDRTPQVTEAKVRIAELTRGGK
jgi:tetratricopeptide (TPR) repeat protein